VAIVDSTVCFYFCTVRINISSLSHFPLSQFIIYSSYERVMRHPLTVAYATNIFIFMEQ
jgi:hypothetical protein